MFVYKEVKASDVIAAISEPEVTAKEETALLAYLHRFLLESDENGKCTMTSVLICMHDFKEIIHVTNSWIDDGTK